MNLLALARGALQLPEVEQLQFIEQQTREHPQLRSEALAIFQQAKRSTVVASSRATQGAGLPLRDGDVLAARYRLLRRIGSGGSADVFLGEDATHRHLVAIKVPRVHSSQPAPEDRARFLREGEILKKLTHRHIVRLLDTGEADGRLYLVLEYAGGGTLAERFGEPLGEREAAGLIRDVVEGLAAAHAAGIIHRDLKPGNLLFGGADQAIKIADFGIAKVVDVDAESLTQTGTILGTFQYMSPEQLLHGRADERSDLFALGCVIYKTLTGQSPFFDGVGRSAQDELQHARQRALREAPLLRTRLPSIDAGLEAVVHRCLERDPAQRYPSAPELLADLERFLAGKTPLAQPVSPWKRLLKNYRRELRLAGTIAVVAAVAAGAGIIGWRQASADNRRVTEQHIQTATEALNAERYTEALSAFALARDAADRFPRQTDLRRFSEQQLELHGGPAQARETDQRFRQDFDRLAKLQVRATTPEDSMQAWMAPINLCEQLFDNYQIAQHADWKQSSPARFLLATRQAQLERDLEVVWDHYLQAKRVGKLLPKALATIGVVVIEDSFRWLPIVMEVVPDSPAAKAGVKFGDKLLKIGTSEGRRLATNDEVLNELRGMPNTELQLDVFRPSEARRFPIKILRSPEGRVGIRAQRLEQWVLIEPAPEVSAGGFRAGDLLLGIGILPPESEPKIRNEKVELDHGRGFYEALTASGAQLRATVLRANAETAEVHVRIDPERLECRQMAWKRWLRQDALRDIVGVCASFRHSPDPAMRELAFIKDAKTPLIDLVANYYVRTFGWPKEFVTESLAGLDDEFPHYWQALDLQGRVAYEKSPLGWFSVEELLRQQLQETPDHPDSWRLLALCALHRKDPSAIVTALGRYLHLRGNDPLAHKMRAEAYEELQQATKADEGVKFREAARADWQRVRELRPDDTDARTAIERLAQLSVLDLRQSMTD